MSFIETRLDLDAWYARGGQHSIPKDCEFWVCCLCGTQAVGPLAIDKNAGSVNASVALAQHMAEKHP